jgi:hypothetical protein
MFSVPRAKEEKVKAGTSWRGNAKIDVGDLVAVTATVNGIEPWACEIECTIRQTGTKFFSKSTTNAMSSRPAPTCPLARPATATCVFQAQASD